MKKVAIVNGAVRQFKYNKYLEQKYAELGYTATEFKFNPVILFCCHLHGRLDPQVRDILDNFDVIHSQSGGFFPLVNAYADKNLNKPFIMETPVLRSTTGTLLAGINLSKSYKVKDNAIIQKALDTFCFTPPWVARTMNNLAELKKTGKVFVLASEEDSVSDNRGMDHHIHHMLKKGKHGRLFFDNDFKLVEEFIKAHPSNDAK